MKAGAPAAPDFNDVKYDAFLANDRTLADPEVIRVEPGNSVLLRVINSSAMSAYHLDLGGLSGKLIAVGEPLDCSANPFFLMVFGRNFSDHLEL